jgi:hypothetical protein
MFLKFLKYQIFMFFPEIVEMFEISDFFEIPEMFQNAYPKTQHFRNF